MEAGQWIEKKTSKQKGKARSKQFGKVEIPQEAFIGVLKINKKHEKNLYVISMKNFRRMTIFIAIRRVKSTPEGKNKF